MAENEDAMLADIERERLEALAGHDENFGEQLEARFGKDSFGMHEAYDRAWIVYELFQQYVVGSPAVALRPDLYRKARAVEDALADFYNEAACYDAVPGETNASP